MALSLYSQPIPKIIVIDKFSEQPVHRLLIVFCIIICAGLGSRATDLSSLMKKILKNGPPQQGCGSGSGVFAWIRIRFSNISGSGSGFQISLDPDPVFKFLWIRIRFQYPDPGSQIWIRILGAKVI